MCLVRFLLFAMVAAVVVPCLVGASSSTSDQSLIQINILVLVPWPDSQEYTGWDFGLQLLPGGRIASREINNSSEILPGYELVIHEAGHDACGLTVHSLGLTSLAGIAITPTANIAAVLGMYCSSNTLALSPVAGRKGVDLIQLSASYSPVFKDNHDQFQSQHLYRLVPSADVYAKIILRLAEQYDWSKIAVVTNTENVFYSDIAASLVREFTAENSASPADRVILYRGSLIQRFASFRAQVISDIIERRARIVVLLAESAQIADLLCEAIKMNMKYPNYLWIIPDLRLSGLLADASNCNNEAQLRLALNGAVLFYLFFVPLKNDSTRNGDAQVSANAALVDKYEKSISDDALVDKFEKFETNYWEEFEVVKRDYREVLNESRNTLNGNLEYATLLYNQVYAISLALNNSIPKLKQANLSLDNYGYGQPAITEIIEDSLKSTSFTGFTGEMRFNDYNEVDIPVLIFQVIDGNEVLIQKLSSYEIHNKSIALQLDERVDDEPSTHYVTIGVIFTSILAICLAILFGLVTVVLVLLLKYRNTRKVKASSVKVSMLMFVACYFFIIADVIIIIMTSIELSLPAYSGLCSLSYFFFYNAFIMLFSTQIFKQRRINVIFNNSSFKTYGWWYSNWMLGLKAIAVCLIGDLIWLVIILIKPQRQYFFEDYEFADGVTVRYRYPYCYAGEDNVLFYGLYLSIALLLILNIYHATSAKKTMKDDFRNTKLVNLYMVTVFVTLSLTVPFKEAFFAEKKAVLYINIVVFISNYIPAALAQLILFLPLILDSVRKTKRFQRAAETLHKISQFHS